MRNKLRITTKSRSKTSRRGLSTLETMLSLAAMLPAALGLLMLLWKTVVSFHLHVGFVAGSPLM